MFCGPRSTKRFNRFIFSTVEIKFSIEAKVLQLIMVVATLILPGELRIEKFRVAVTEQPRPTYKKILVLSVC